MNFLAFYLMFASCNISNNFVLIIMEDIISSEFLLYFTLFFNFEILTYHINICLISSSGKKNEKRKIENLEMK